jgi:hypothetical protein
MDRSIQVPSRMSNPRVYTGMFVFVLIISVSYWYCLPVTTQSIIRYSEFRGYDFLLLLLAIVLVFKYWHKLRLFFRHDKPGRWILRFSIWASITFIMTIVHTLMYRPTFYILMTFVMLFHLWGFVLAYAAVRIFVTERRQCFVLLDVFLVAGLIEALICSGAKPTRWHMGQTPSPVRWDQTVSCPGTQ